MRLLTIILAFVAATSATAEFGDYREHVVDQGTLAITTDRGVLNITARGSAAFEVHYIEAGVKQLPSFAISESAGSVTTAKLEDTPNLLVFHTPDLAAVIYKSDVRIQFFRHGNELVSEEHGYFAHDTVRGFRFALDDDEKILGGGERVLGMDRRGHRLPLYNQAHYGYTTESSQMYYSLPAVMSDDHYMLVFDNAARGWLDIGKSEADVLSFEAVGGRTAYLVVAGNTYPELIQNYTAITGRQPLPPRWAFGNFASRFGYRTEQEARDVVHRFRRMNIPLDAIVLDIYWFGPDIKGHMGNLDWDRQAWPDPQGMMDDFLRDGVRTIPITEPFVLSTSKRWDEAVNEKVLAKTATGDPHRFDFYFGNTGLIDLFDDAASDWFWSWNKKLLDQGAAGTWGDLGEPEVHPGGALHWLSDPGIAATADEIHNAYGHTWARRIYENKVAAWPDKRPMIMMRSGFVGSQRYGMIPWTGDVSREWAGLKPQIELGLQMGLFGLGYTHSDLGGFAGGEVFDKEMYIRWLQYGVFQPVYRPHAQDHIAPEPVFHDRETRRIVRDFINLRYRLLPYNYTLAWENTTTGMPLMRPVFFENEADPALISEKDSYLWGDAFFVAPVTDPGVESIATRLPDGVWFDFWTDRRYEGGPASIPVTLETIPVLVRAGAFVPMTPEIQTTRDFSSEQLTLHYYADESIEQSSGQLYEDDGESRDSLENGAYELLKFEATHRDDYLGIDLTRTGDGYTGAPKQRTIKLLIHNWQSDIRRLRVNGRPARATTDGDVVTVKLSWDGGPTKIELNTAPSPAKPVVYQMFTRLFGNTNSSNEPWGTIEQNGVGKFSDVSDAALRGIRELGVSHIWYTGVPHHAVIRDYTEFGVSNDDPDVVKGRAGSPYAVKDYFSVNPDLADNPADRVQEFVELIERTHANGMRVVIDIVPNHVARAYESTGKPKGIEDFGASDDTSVAWARDNDFYYVVGEDFAVPSGYQPLNGEAHPLADGRFRESPAKWTGNGARAAQPRIDDWFETVKINFGVRPDGSYAFDKLPDEARGWSNQQLVEFWAERDVPASWRKFHDIVHFWLDKGVDGFRYDMAQMVPVEFWSYLNSSIKVRDPGAFLLSEIYVPEMYRDYIELGRMDYLYDKVGLYDSLKRVLRGEAAADSVADAHADVLDIERHMLHFLENHDEQRIASDAFAGNAEIGKPGMVVSALLGRSPTMIYFGQEVGERAEHDAGFGKATRTTIFDYAGVPAHQRWMNGGAFDGGALSDSERELRDFYVRLLGLSTSHPAMQGNYNHLPTEQQSVFAFARWQDDTRVIVISNFSSSETIELALDIPVSTSAAMGIDNGRFELVDLLGGGEANSVLVDNGHGTVRVTIEPLQSLVYEIRGGQFKARDEAPFVADVAGANVRGTLIYWRDVPSQHLSETRNVVVWLPPGYEDNPERRYRVIYMSDGENLFDPRIASWGVDWGVDEAMMRGVEQGKFDAAIVVGTWSTAKRSIEYSPWHEAADYAAFLRDELMPRVNDQFRTRTGPENSFAMGSSMGGLLSFYLVSQHPDLVSACGCVSSHFRLSARDYAWLDGQHPTTLDPTPYVVKDIAAGATLPRQQRFLFDYGTESLDATYEEDHAKVLEWFRQQGLKNDSDYRFVRFDGADHSERAWRARLDDQLEWLLSD